MTRDFRDKVVVITGSSAGIGRATAIEFARQGAKLALLARGSQRLQPARDEVERAGGTAISIETDVADSEQVEAAAERAESELGPIDVWINNAMASVLSPITQTTPAEVARVTEVTYLGAVYGTLAALKRMIPRNRGAIIQVGSALAYRSIPLQAPYCAAKHALQGFTESLYSELIHDGSDVHVTMVQLPAVNTPQFEWVRSRLAKKAQPVPPIFQPEVAARAIVWSAAHRRRELVVGWPAIQAIEANKIAPGLIDRFLARNGYESQQTQEPEDPNRPDNLWQPAPGDWGSHGRFDAQAKSFSWALWAETHRPLIAAGIAALGLAGMLSLRR
ncbi:MAG TPA: SDR family oxidoreductase [Dehalococcoidia bacterium]|nr:SDR family oxidoreductase [Dehalococcoidia bacterium]